jgi:hypothetical protein
LAGIVTGCSAEMKTESATWTLVADDSGGLVDLRHPEFGAYPNPLGVQRLQIRVSEIGEVCADHSRATWCGGPIQGIPYLTRGFIEGSATCLRMVDVFGNDVLEQCGLALNLEDMSPEAGCQDSRRPDGTACEICTDEAGIVTTNTCAVTGMYDEFTEAADCATEHGAVTLGVELFARVFNDGLARIGLDLAVVPPTDAAALVSFDRGDISLSSPSCGDVMDYLDSEFSDDHPGTDDYVFGPEAIERCLSQGDCKIGQLVTRSMAEACESIPAGCNMDRVQMGIIGSGGFAVEAVCEGTEAGAEFGVLGDDGAVTDCIGSPLVVDVAGDGLALRGPSPDTLFALSGAGPMSIGWTASTDDALLALDLDGDGAITSGAELFGEATGGWAPDGFAALARHDDNGDGAIDAADPVYSSLLLWHDDGDARSTPGELVPLSVSGLERIHLARTRVDETDAAGNLLGLASSAVAADGHDAPIIDVWFKIAP